MVDHPRTLLGDEPGIGKTIQSLGLVNFMSEFSDLKVLIFCPASVKMVWQSEIAKWVIAPYRIRTYTGKRSEDTGILDKYNISFHLCNYDAITKDCVRRKFIGKKGARPQWDILIIDECHILRNSDTKATKRILGNGTTFGIIDLAVHTVALSGTPMVNRPLDMFPINSVFAPDLFTEDKHFYGTMFCDGKRTQWGWDYKGHSNMVLFNEYLQTFMLRRYKNDVLPQLPDKTMQTIQLGTSKHTLLEQKIVEENGIRLGEDFITEGELVMELDSMSELRREMGEAKVPLALDFIKSFLEGNDEYLIIFAHHKSVIDALRTGLSKVKDSRGRTNEISVVTGATTMARRKQAVHRFMDRAYNNRVFIGNIQSAGVGLTLTRASRVMFVELSWLPSEISQAIDRAHRNGQKNAVLAQFLVYNDSLEEHMAKILEKKCNAIDAGIDGIF